MRFQLASQHYIDDRLLEPGMVIGDDTAVPFRFLKDTKSKDEKGNPIVMKAGSPMAPSREMIPLDDEAQALFDKRFPGDIPPGDPTMEIPLQGTLSPVRVPGQAAERPNPTAPQPRPTPAPTPQTGMRAPPPNAGVQQQTPATSGQPANPVTQPAKPPGHDSSKNPGDAKDTETAKAPNINKL